MCNINFNDLILQKIQYIFSKNLTWDQYTTAFKIINYHQHEIISYLCEDLNAMERRDPASNGKQILLIGTSSSYFSVMIYRISHLLLEFGNGDQYIEQIAFSITELSRRLCGVDINPYALIGKRFVLDHSHGIIIGETTSIGNDAYILGGAILGARGIANNRKVLRHPQIGDNVEIGAYTRILGPVSIGDNVKISPYSIINKDIPSNTKVKIYNQLQFVDCMDFNNSHFLSNYSQEVL